MNKIPAWANWMTIIATLTILGITAYSVLRSENPELTVHVLASDELTALADIKYLSADYQYRGSKVANLWKVSLSIINSGNKTIIGEGTQKTLIRDGIYLSFPSETMILNIETEVNEPSTRNEQTDSNNIKIIFFHFLNLINIVIHITPS